MLADIIFFISCALTQILDKSTLKPNQHIAAACDVVTSRFWRYDKINRFQFYVVYGAAVMVSSLAKSF